MKIVSVVGARPNFIKLGPMSKEIRKTSEEIIIHTGQHYDREMSSLLFEEMGIPKPDYNLDINQGTPTEQISRMMVDISHILDKERPDLTVVYGDTNSTVAGAIASIQRKIPCAHVEAGPRNRSMLINEMLNRVIVDRISTLLFCATRHNLETLAREGRGDYSYFVGDHMYDAYLQYLPLAEKRASLLKEVGVSDGGYHLATCHRAETTDHQGRLASVMEAFKSSDKPVLFPAHPRTVKMLKQFGMYDDVSRCDNIIMTGPVGYLEILLYGTHADKIITDSGGVQREAFFMGKPCVVIYDESSWPEIFETGWQVITGLRSESILDSIHNFKVPAGPKPDVFGNGDASVKTMKVINEFDFTDWHVVNV